MLDETLRIAVRPTETNDGQRVMTIKGAHDYTTYAILGYSLNVVHDAVIPR